MVSELNLKESFGTQDGINREILRDYFTSPFIWDSNSAIQVKIAP